MALTIRRILGFAAVNDVHPQVLGQAHLLDSPVLGIHLTESADLSGLLEGGELILSSGLCLTTSLEATKTFLEGLAEAGAAGVIFSFLSDVPEVKKCLAVAAETAPLPVVLLDDRARFVEITETVHSLIYSAARGLSGVDAVSSFLSSTAAAHLDLREMFSTIADTLDEPLVLEDSESGVVLQRGLSPKQIRRFTAAPAMPKGLGTGARTVGEATWLVYPVVIHGRSLGQLVTPVGAGNLRASRVLEDIATVLGAMLPNGPEDIALLRQGSLALLIKDARSGDSPDENGLTLRARMLGAKSVDQFVPIAVNFKPSARAVSSDAAQDVHSVVATLQRALLDAPHRAFACVLGKSEAGIVLCLSPSADLEGTLAELHLRIGRALDPFNRNLTWTMGVGTGSSELGAAALGGLDDACRVAHSASSMDHSSASYHRAGDLGFRWLMQQLLDLEETRTYLHDQLAPFLDEPEYLDFIETYLQTNGSVTEISRALHLSRPSVYARMRRIEKVLGHELTDADTMTSLHLAVTLYRLGVRDQES
ncbi:PucR family transcriptional regulator [Paeniglutamicibacter psychrophenolicus]|uniref:PucR family transcriptional regulator n=1 Tax=Paeniglutamicibacter psychrophenolicus TaxID=257454 RepID=A0ABS4WC45_9MICC|nr:PucR family transcriptional regulator [Paeniglutamicibacter psychrophenolicus]MBP2373774.1 hypothetical protein [Paeniglutamicibacter psychrophenolicus]